MATPNYDNTKWSECVKNWTKTLIGIPFVIMAIELFKKDYSYTVGEFILYLIAGIVVTLLLCALFGYIEMLFAKRKVKRQKAQNNSADNGAE